MKKHMTWLTIILCLVLILPSISTAAIVGISPSSVRIDNVLRGGYAERFFTVSIDSEEPVEVQVTPRGETANWFEYTKELNVSRKNPGRIFFSINPPTDIPNGDYTGFLRVSTGPLGQGAPEGHAASAIRAVLDAAITTQIIDTEILSCRASGFSVQTVEKGDDVLISLTIRNDGNIRLKPQVDIVVWDQEQLGIVTTKTLRGTEILPTRKESQIFRIPTKDLSIDQYWIEITVPECSSATKTLTFDVLEQGALKANGILKKILSQEIGEVGETIPLYALFENNGEKNVDARFKGQITYNGKIIQILESEQTEVLMNTLTNFTFFFTPKKAGKYIASGRVFYDKKRTFELSEVITIKPKTFRIQTVLLLILYVAILLVIGLLFYKIRREKRRYIRRLKGQTG